MSDIEKELWGTLDEAVFGTRDPESIRHQAIQAIGQWQQGRSTLGGYLSSIRKLRGRRTAEFALQAGVSRQLWQAWEADRALPKPQELEQISERLGFGAKKREKLRQLKAEAPKIYLKRLLDFRPELLAARGVSKVDPTSEWSALPDEVRELIKRWAHQQGIGTPTSLFSHLATLKTESEKETWLQKVLHHE